MHGAAVLSPATTRRQRSRAGSIFVRDSKMETIEPGENLETIAIVAIAGKLENFVGAQANLILGELVVYAIKTGKLLWSSPKDSEFVPNSVVTCLSSVGKQVFVGYEVR